MKLKSYEEPKVTLIKYELLDEITSLTVDPSSPEIGDEDDTEEFGF